MKPHKHAALIKAWADGCAIQEYIPPTSSNCEFGWTDNPNPTWHKHAEYRIKPREFEVGAFYPAINRYGHKCLIECTGIENKVTFKEKHEFWAEPRYHWIGKPLNIEWPEE